MEPAKRVVIAPEGRKTEIRILATYFQSEARVWAVKVLVDRSVVVSSAWPDFKVRRMLPDGSPIEGPDAVVDAPHVTFHPPGYFHLRAERLPFIIEGLVWNSPEPGWTYSPWLNFISPQLAGLAFREPAKTTLGRKIRWCMPVARKGGSLTLIVDFIERSFIDVDPDGFRSKYIIAGDSTLRFRIGYWNGEREPAVVFTIRS